MNGLEGKILLKWMIPRCTLIVGKFQVNLAKKLKFGEFTDTRGDFRSTRMDVSQQKIYDDTK